MRLSQKLMILSAALLGCPSAKAITPGNSSNTYEEIPARNVFGLRAPVLANNEPAPKPLPRVILNGITTVIQHKKALLKVIPQVTKPGQQATEESYILGEHQREGEIEVLKIDEHAGIVKIDNSGTPMTVTFEQSPSHPATAAQAPTPGIGMIPNLRTGPRTLPSRFPRLPLPSSAASQPPVPQTSPVNVPTPTGSTTPTPPSNTAPTAQQLTPEEQTFLLDLQNAMNRDNQGTSPRPATQSQPPPPDNYLPKKVPLMPQ
jgi:hypothetical protein